MRRRAAGILLHISSLPCDYGIGDFGPAAFTFADFLARAGQRYWQLLPLSPPVADGNNSPYDCSSAFAGNTLFISPQLLYKQGLLDKRDIRNKPAFAQTRVNYRRIASYKDKLFDIAYERFERSKKKSDYERFCDENKSWLDDFVLFTATSRHFRNRLWSQWPAELRERKTSAVKSVKAELASAINREKFLQFVFFEQWRDLKNYCGRLGIRLIGDIPFYVAYQSADLWSHPELFKLTKTKKPRFIAGVPPDLFSRTGQLWNNPVYNWPILKKTGYRWWLARIKHNLDLFDIVRLDHFRGFYAFWQVPAGSRNAVKGRWTAGPGESFFRKLLRQFPLSAFIVEDLGRITHDVRELRDKFNLTGTKVLIFGFGKNSTVSPHNPRSFVKNSVVFTSTHDSNTVKGWFDNEADAGQKKKLFECLGNKVSAGKVPWELIRLAMESVPDTAVIPVQDILGLGGQARMNRPATVKGNWQWRLTSGKLNSRIADKLRKLTEAAGRVT